ncbi:monoamine oxidase [Sporomusaceae bacterium BoRhaA]|uniref:flavin monoamine oxidase family protein n=1 Tax=Pelorhabdus rhamnosifermentans TaxID=2772457 RepID=UPI001FE4C1D9|nr:NAD(P)/FAD-dependent oxidoreductase [Pelorhabdus rhamnosifermentans]MBU2700054.1 monoamine oxidase [Pelorhabdus rhamnosifermentans]
MPLYSHPLQPNNPSSLQRNEILQYALNNVNRPEDFGNIKKLLEPPVDITTITPPGSFAGVKVGIIGGGLAGLASAFELRKLGCDITILEALEERIGGRVYTYHFDKLKKLYGEFGPMRIPVCHNTVWHYIDIFKLNTRPFVQKNGNSFIFVRNVRTRNRNKDIMKKIYPEFNLRSWEKDTPWDELFDFLSAPLYQMAPAVRKELLEIKPYYHPQIQYWNSINFRQQLECVPLSQPAISLSASIAPLTGTAYYDSDTEVLAEYYPLIFSFLYEIIGGSANLPLAFYKSLISVAPHEYQDIPNNKLGKITWKRGNRVNGIYLSRSNNQVIVKHMNRHLNIAYDHFDYVICAIPFSSLRTVEINPLLSDKKMQAIREVNYKVAQKTLFLCNRRFWETGGPNTQIVGGGSYTDLPISMIWYPSDHAECILKDYRKDRVYQQESPFDTWTIKPMCSPEDPGVLLASYNLSLDAVRLGNLSDTLRFAEIKRQVEAVHGLTEGYLDSVVEDFKTVQWNREEPFYGAFAAMQPQQKSLFLYAMAQPEYNNRLFFAGEHISTQPHWMQGALSSGIKAANALAYSCRGNTIF